MKQYTFGLILVLTAALVIVSCQKQLNLEPISNISSSVFWKTDKDATGALFGMYARLKTVAQSDLFLLGESRSESMSGSVASSGSYQGYIQNTITPINTTVNWQKIYLVIHDANLILKYVPAIGFTSDANKKNILAQAYTMRAYLYFVLARSWGDVPLVTEPTEGYSAETTQRPKTPVAEVFGQIKRDLDSAAANFQTDAFPAGRNMWSRPAMHTLKGDVYLWTAKVLNGGQADLTVALDALNKAAAADAVLLSDFNQVFDYANKGNKEILMGLSFRLLDPGSLAVYADMYAASTYFPVALIDQATRDAVGALGGAPYWEPSALVRSQFDNDDRRKNATFIEIYTRDPKDPNPPKYHSSVNVKFNGVVDGGVRKWVDDLPLYRYADVLLLKAEVKNAMGMDPAEEINAIRSRAYGTNMPAHLFVSGSKAYNDEQLLKERLLEFLFEGKRWWDLLRFNKAFELVPSLASQADKQYLKLWPIALTTLSLEPKVTQNPGYE
ncbi:MAG: RagB/SusD family nutrient uptake outer membrane protein [Niabella sp.]|nr:RagB/SusD family nutrient uptake outer membrane protein [Niabella sp.]